MPPERDWVELVRGGCCPDCGLDAGAVPPEQLAARLEAAAASWAEVLSGTPVDRLRARPDRAAWSALEYGGHVQGVLDVFTARVDRMLDEDDPALGWWDHEAAVVEQRLQDAEPALVGRAITDAAAALGARLDGLGPEQWARTGQRRAGEHFSIEGLVRFAWHELVHHRHDVTVLLQSAWSAHPSDASEAALLLRTPPVRPADTAAFSAGRLFGQPGIYPDGPPMSPAPGPPLDDDAAHRLLDQLLGDELAATAHHRMVDPDLRARVPDLQVRTALLSLTGSPAEPELDAFLEGSTAVQRLGIGPTDGEGRVIGAELGDADPTRRVLNERYRAEHPAVIAPSLAHALCHHGERASNAEEATLHGLLAAVHAWLLSGTPALGLLRTELARRQASLTVTLLNARAPGDAAASICCPDGPGTIPGGDPSLQCPDLWSIPFTSRRPDDADLDVPAPVGASLARLAAGTAPEVPDRYDDALGGWLRAQLGHGVWFGPVVRARAGLALGLFCDDPAGVAQSS